jgi:hypothetical protein
MSTCRGCGKEIVWAETSHGKKVPLDPKALVFSVMDQGGKLIAVKPSGGPAGERFMVSHFATCPDAEDFSGRNSKGSQEAPAPRAEINYSEPKTADDDVPFGQPITMPTFDPPDPVLDPPSDPPDFGGGSSGGGGADGSW